MPNPSGATDPAGNPGSPDQDQSRQSASVEPASSPNTNLDRETRDLIYYNSLLEKLLNVITHGEEESVTHVISTIRAGASHDQIVETIDRLTANASSRTNGAGNGA